MDDQKVKSNNEEGSESTKGSFLSKESEIESSSSNLEMVVPQKETLDSSPGQMAVHISEMESNDSNIDLSKSETSILKQKSTTSNNEFANSIYQPVYTSSNAANSATKSPAPQVSQLQPQHLSKAAIVTPIVEPEKPREKIVYRDRGRGCGFLGGLFWRFISFLGCFLFVISAIIIAVALWINF